MQNEIGTRHEALGTREKERKYRPTFDVLEDRVTISEGMVLWYSSLLPAGLISPSPTPPLTDSLPSTPSASSAVSSLLEESEWFEAENDMAVDYYALGLEEDENPRLGEQPPIAMFPEDDSVELWAFAEHALDELALPDSSNEIASNLQAPEPKFGSPVQAVGTLSSGSEERESGGGTGPDLIDYTGSVASIALPTEFNSSSNSNGEEPASTSVVCNPILAEIKGYDANEAPEGHTFTLTSSEPCPIPSSVLAATYYDWQVNSLYTGQQVANGDQESISFTIEDDDLIEVQLEVRAVYITNGVGEHEVIARGTKEVLVYNVDPTVSASVNSPIYENDSATVSFTISDPSPVDTFHYIVSWGDGNTTMFPEGVEGTSQRSFSVPHQYLDDDPTATPQDDYQIIVEVFDDDGGAGKNEQSLTVKNVAPTVYIEQSTTNRKPPPDGTVTYSAIVDDPGSEDTHLYRWVVNVNGKDTLPCGDMVPEKKTCVIPTTEYGNYSVELTVWDDDGEKGSAADSFEICKCVWSGSVRITTVGVGVPGVGVGYFSGTFEADGIREGSNEEYHISGSGSDIAGPGGFYLGDYTLFGDFEGLEAPCMWPLEMGMKFGVAWSEVNVDVFGLIGVDGGIGLFGLGPFRWIEYPFHPSSHISTTLTIGGVELTIEQIHYDPP